MMNSSVQVNLKKRKLLFYGEEKKLSNYDIKHLRQISGSKKFSDEKAKRALKKVINKQIKPFLKDTDRELNQENLREEIRESLHTHIYIFLEDVKKD